MTRLILVRHAKSSWDEPALGDFDRPLNKRGRADAPRIGACLAARGHRAEGALISTATRAIQTFARLHHDAVLPPARFLDALYHAAPETMLGTLRGTDTEVAVVMMVGHNPGIGSFAGRLLAERPEDAVFDRFPTCAAAVIDFPAAAWDAVTWRSGVLLDFIVPSHLE